MSNDVIHVIQHGEEGSLNDLHCPKCGCTWFGRPSIGGRFDFTKRKCKNCKHTYTDVGAYIKNTGVRYRRLTPERTT